MACVSIPDVRLAGIAAAVPPMRRMTFDELGIPADRFKRARAFNRQPAVRSAKWEQCQSDFCQRAAEGLLKDLGWSATEVDVIVMVTITPDYPIPATAIIMQDRLGMKKTSLAFDLPGSTTTFLHGMQLVASMLSAGNLKRGLLLCGEVSKIAEGAEGIENVEYICGHNGGVCALEHTPGADPMIFHSGGDGSKAQAFYMPVGGTRCPPRPEMFADGDSAAFENPAVQFTLDVGACHEVANRELPLSTRAVLAHAGKTVSDVDLCFVQPMGIDAEEELRATLGLRKDRFHGFTYEYGSGGSGGILLAMLARAASQLQSGPRTSLLTSIGAGLAWGSALINTDRLVCPDLIEMS
ncbi:MAG: 3-oxoacyl-[acyl-carrier-protein] synthase III C-terminal domain-containing protein [Chthoniobacteraceae bacterium]